MTATRLFSNGSYFVNGSFDEVTQSTISVTGNTVYSSQFDEFTGVIIVDSTLSLWLDAGQSQSYSGSGTTWTDLSGKGNHGTLTNGPTFSSTNGGSIVFDGTDDRVDCGTNSSTDLSSSLTLNAWIYPTGFGEGNFGRIIDRQAAGNFGYVFFLDNTGTTGTNGIRYISDNGQGSSTNPTISNVVDLNVWANFSVTQTGTTALVYKNGILVGTLTNIPARTSSSVALTIGNRPAGDRTFQGNIATVSAYNRALSATEILQNFNALRGRFGL